MKDVSVFVKKNITNVDRAGRGGLRREYAVNDIKRTRAPTTEQSMTAESVAKQVTRGRSLLKTS